MSLCKHRPMARCADRIGLATMIAFAVGFAACESDETPAPTPATTTTTSSTTGTGAGGSGGSTTTATSTSSEGGAGGAVGQGGAGGQGQCTPLPENPPFTFCGGTGSVGSSMGTTCTYCVQDANGDDYTVECTDGTCTCSVNDTPVCICQNAPNAGCTDSCCPAPWASDLTPTGAGGGGGGGGGGTSTVTVGTSAVSTGTG